MSDEKIILDTSPEAASIRTVVGWVSRHGWYWGEDASAEGMARYDGCTHRACPRCGTPIPKLRILCPECCAARDTEAFNARPKAEWDGEAMLYSETLDEYFSSPGEALDDEAEEGKELEDLRLILCVPVIGSHIDYDHFVDALADDADPPDELVKAIEAFNAAVDAAGPLSWTPGKFALACSSAQTVKVNDIPQDDEQDNQE